MTTDTKTLTPEGWAAWLRQFAGTLGADAEPTIGAASTVLARQQARIAELEGALADLLAFDDKDDPRHQEVCESVYDDALALEVAPSRALLTEGR